MEAHFPFLIKWARKQCKEEYQMSILEVSGLKKTYSTRFGASKVEALRNVNFSVEQGSMWP